MSVVTITGGTLQNIEKLSTIVGANHVLNGRIDGVKSNVPVRYELGWVAGERGKPGLNGDFVSTVEATQRIADPNFEVLGGNASSDDVTYNAEGGITFTTDGSDGDGLFLLPHLDANLSPWKQVLWGTDKETEWECSIKSGASIGNTIIWAGLKLTNTDVVATDDDQVYFRYENDVTSGNWVAVSSNTDSDTTTDTGVVMAASTKYHLRITIDDQRIARFYIDGALVETTSALADTIDLIPYICVEADGAGNAMTLDIYGQAISRVAG